MTTTQNTSTARIATAGLPDADSIGNPWGGTDTRTPNGTIIRTTDEGDGWTTLLEMTENGCLIWQAQFPADVPLAVVIAATIAAYRNAR